MNNWFYYSSIRSVSFALTHAFSGLKIKKIDGEGNISNSIDVPLKYGLKEKFWYWLNDNKQEAQFPIMGLSLTSLSYAQDRATAKLERIHPVINETKVKEMLAPSPWRITYNLGIATKYQIELDQILEQILPFFNPFMMLSINIQDIPMHYDAKVILGSVSPENMTSIDTDDYRHIIWNIELNVDAWMFKPCNDRGLIQKIILNYHKKEKLVEQQIIDGTKDPITCELRNRDFYEG